jgi:hypothetical protein
MASGSIAIAEFVWLIDEVGDEAAGRMVREVFTDAVVDRVPGGVAICASPGFGKTLNATRSPTGSTPRWRFGRMGNSPSRHREIEAVLLPLSFVGDSLLHRKIS